MKNKIPKVGDLRVWWIPQIPMDGFHIDISTIEEGVKIMNVLADYDKFQFDNNIKPDYCNAGGIERYDADNGDGENGWCSWYDEESGEDNPELYLEEKAEIARQLSCNQWKKLADGSVKL